MHFHAFPFFLALRASTETSHGATRRLASPESRGSRPDKDEEKEKEKEGRCVPPTVLRLSLQTREVVGNTGISTHHYTISKNRASACPYAFAQYAGFTDCCVVTYLNEVVDFGSLSDRSIAKGAPVDAEVAPISTSLPIETVPSCGTFRSPTT